MFSFLKQSKYSSQKLSVFSKAFFKQSKFALSKRDNSGFTLIEMLVVISILGMLATMSIGSYQRTRQAAELKNQIDVFMDEMRSTKSLASSSSNKCYGFQISKTGILEIESDYLDPFNKCTTSLLTSPSNLQIEASQIKRDQQVQELKSVDILFYPPLGETFLPAIDLKGEKSFETIFFKFKMGSKTNGQIISFNSSNSSIQKIVETVTAVTNSSNSPQTSTNTTIIQNPDINSPISPPIQNENQEYVSSSNFNSNYTQNTGGSNDESESISSKTSSQNSLNNGGTTSVPELSHETNPIESSKQNPITFVLIITISIILGMYLTRSK